VIFSHGFLKQLEARWFIYGVTLEVIVTSNSEIQRINLTRTRE
jgi:hypothetical protein